MEKKGDLFNQLAMISDLLVKCNLDSTSQTIVLEVSSNEFENIYRLVQSKVKTTSSKPEGTFNVRIGSVNIIFNRNNA
jgi:hypothetical protein